MKKRSLISILLCALLAYAGCAHAFSGSIVSVLRIGKADAIIITNGSNAILIDAGEEDDIDEILEFFAEKRINAIDMMIITHFDKDHVGGADGVLHGIRVNAVYDAGYESDSKQYGEYLDALQATGVPRTRVLETTEMRLGALTLTLMPAGQPADDDNNNSLVIAMDDGFHTFLFAGDAEEQRIDELLLSAIGQYDFLKMPHHGRMKTNLDALLDQVSPQIAVITDSDKNPADTETLALLAGRGIDTYETRDGDIHVTSSQSGLFAVQ